MENRPGVFAGLNPVPFGARNWIQSPVGQINASSHRLDTDATLHCVPSRKLQRWAPPAIYRQTVLKGINEYLILIIAMAVFKNFVKKCKR